jgi:hypothetical protein
MTEPLTFSSPPSAYPLVKDEPKGFLMAGVHRAADAARGKNDLDILEDNMM